MVALGLILYFLDNAVVSLTNAFNAASVGVWILKFPIKAIPTLGVLFQAVCAQTTHAHQALHS